MARKRKEPTTAQSSTILDFFGNRPALSNTKGAKKQKINGAPARRNSAPPVKREYSGDIIVIDDSDSDSEVEVSAIRPAPQPVQNAPNVAMRSAPAGCTQEVQHATPALADPSAHACHSARMDETDRSNEGQNVKSEPDLSRCVFGLPAELLVPPSPVKLEDAVSEALPSGSLPVLATQEQPAVADSPVNNVPPPVVPDCSHDGVVGDSLETSTQAGYASQLDALLGEGDWDRGDDEMELVEEADAKVKAEEDDAVDIDLTLDDDVDIGSAPQEKPVETCLICERVLTGMSNLVRTSTCEAYVPFNVILGDP